MSNQSGIVAEQEVLDAVNSLASRHSSIVAKIVQDNEPVIKLEKILDGLDAIKGFLEGNQDEPYYIIINDDPKKIFISYTPDYAPTRSKMLYASSKITFQRQLGSNSLKSFMFTEVEDIDERSWNDTTSTTELMTSSELEQLDIDAQQASLRSVRAVKLASAQQGNSLGFNIQNSGDIAALFDHYNMLIFKIDLTAEEIVVESKINISQHADILETLPKDTPSYSIYKNEGKYYFIFSCPSGSSIKQRMVYAANKRQFLVNLQELDNIVMKNTFEIGDAEELELSEFSESSNKESPATATKTRFNKPKAPSRRR